ncbi:MAG: alpha/beta fold hydrolase [Chloroflexota bacterium]|nr:alpha/beta fold hydrolase [Chloroflexota bacterium]
MNEPTILVPGFKDTIHVLRPLVNVLAKAGLHPVPMSPQPSNGGAGIEVLAAQLAAQIEAAFPAEQAINLVGFSMGGLICRTYVQKLGGANRTHRLVTVATPHQGTWLAYLYNNRPACLQMRPGSAFLADLNSDLTALAQVQFSSIWTPLDLTIMPANSSRLPIGEVRSIFSPFHGTLLLDPRVLRLVADALRQPLNPAQPVMAIL